jgi:endo-1,4-beta-D-glucanase Y
VETRSVSLRAAARLASVCALAGLACASPPKPKGEPAGEAGTGTSATGESGATGASGTTGGSGTTGASGSMGESGTAGGAGSSAVGTAGTAALATCAQAPPAPAANGAMFPFPQHRFGASCAYPANCSDADVTLAWTNWRKAFVTTAGSALRVRRTSNSNDTVSEGIGYGMMAAAFMADRATFDGLWSYAKARLDENGVMNWHYDANGGSLDGGGGATDADEDMAFALVMADAQWGGYTGDAKTLVGNVLAHEVESGTNVLKPGDRWGGSDQTNPSYLAPAYYRVFASYTGQSQWMDVVDASYALLGKCANAKTGLVPDWCNGDGAPQRNSHYSYDACRTPWRIAVDACWNAEPRAQAFLTRESAFFQKVGAANIKDGYGLDGTPLGAANVLAFVGPAGAGALPGPASTLTRDAYTRVKAVSRLAAGSGYDYYDASWGLLTLMLMTGNFADLTSH